MYNDIKVSTDKNLNKGETINIDFDIISHENAIKSVIRENLLEDILC